MIEITIILVYESCIRGFSREVMVRMVHVDGTMWHGFIFISGTRMVR